MADLHIDRLHKQYPSSTHAAVDNFSLRIAEGELVAFLGPSGCGKTTTLRMIAGFVTPSSGRIAIGGTDVTHLPVHRRKIGMVFQRYALFPHMTVQQNVAFGLEMHKVPSAQRATRIRRALDMVRMSSLADRYPRQLSGGQQQRVSIARALAVEPRVFLLDEPLSALDAKLRIEVRDEIRELQKRLGLTTVFVTHDQEEALAIADRMAIMHDGCVQQVGTARTLYEQPANPFVADFLGNMNFFDGCLREGRFVTPGGQQWHVETGLRRANKAGVRPERICLSHAALAGYNTLPARVDSVVYLGAQIEVRLKRDDGGVLQCRMPNAEAASWTRALDSAAPLHVCFRPSDLVLFNQ